MNDFAYRSAQKLSSHTNPPPSCNWYFSFSLVSRSINSGAPASTAPPECSSLGIIASQSQFSVSYWRAEKKFRGYFPPRSPGLFFRPPLFPKPPAPARRLRDNLPPTPPIPALRYIFPPRITLLLLT